MSEQNKGHGHVIPRPDGDKTRCGGPKICKVCQQEQRDFAARTGASIFDVITGTAQGMKPSTAIGDTQLDEMRRDGFSIDGDNAYKRDLLDCVVGALAFGKQGNPAPPEGHWLHRFWEIGDAERKERDELRARLAAQQAAVPVAPRVIGWRTENYLWETSDPAVAKNWEGNIGVLPIFEVDPNTQLTADPAAPQQGVVLPERLTHTTPEGAWFSAGQKDGWNACLDEFARLNADRSAQGGE